MPAKFKKLKRLIVRAISARYDKPLGPPTDTEQELVEELRNTFLQLPSQKKQHLLPSEKEWLDNIRRLRELVLTDDPRRFLRWDVILKTMAVPYASYVAPELKYLKSRTDWASRWADAIRESDAGHPLPDWRYPESSATLIHHAYHWARFEDRTGIRPEHIKYVFEFGGGYGSMCRLLYNLGFDGKYLLYDLAEFSALQKFFLKCLGIPVQSADSFATMGAGAVFVSDLSRLFNIVANDVQPNHSVFIATWSISETPVDFRKPILNLIASFKGFLIAYQDHFKEVNNIEFFRNWIARRHDVEWFDCKIEQIPSNCRYLIGKRT